MLSLSKEETFPSRALLVILWSELEKLVIQKSIRSIYSLSERCLSSKALWVALITQLTPLVKCTGMFQNESERWVLVIGQGNV